MKILVSKIPEKTVECPFSKWSQTTSPYYECLANKDYRYCNGPDKCDVLEEIKKPKIAFVCDQKACKKCSYPTCRHTTDVSHALNFSDSGGGIYFEDVNVANYTEKPTKSVLKAKIKEYLPDEEILCQLAEEASELAKAALKYRRALDEKNPTPTPEMRAFLNLKEETADVLVCLDLLFDQNDRDGVNRIAEFKSNRWVKRLEEKCVEQKEDDSACRTSTK